MSSTNSSNAVQNLLQFLGLQQYVRQLPYSQHYLRSYHTVWTTVFHATLHTHKHKLNLCTDSMGIDPSVEMISHVDSKRLLTNRIQVSRLQMH